MVLCLGTLLCHFYLPCHKKEVKLTLSFQTAADPEREKKKKKSPYFTIEMYSSMAFDQDHILSLLMSSVVLYTKTI